MLAGAKYIRELYENDEFGVIIVQGPHGYGKSSYANNLIAEAYYLENNGIKKPNWNIDFFHFCASVPCSFNCFHYSPKF